MGRRKSRSRGPAEEATERVVSAFCAHWQSIARSRKNMASEREICFLAGSKSARMRLAQSFYCREHARKMASLNCSEVRELLSPWLEHAVKYWLDNELWVGEKFLEELPCAEYVSIVILSSPCVLGGVMLDRYPCDRAAYDDLYEHLLSGFSTGGILRMYKSSGEPFSPFEARSVRAGIRRELLEGIADAGDDDPWVLNTEAEGLSIDEGFEEEDFERVVIVEASKEW